MDREIGQPIESETEEEFKAAVNQLILDVMDALYKHRPNTGQVADALLQILVGTLLQIPEGGSRERMRRIMHRAIDSESDEDTVGVDLSERLKSCQH